MKQVIRILSASADGQLVQTVHDIIKKVPQFFCVGECRTGAELLQIVRRECPNVILLDYALPDCDSLSLLYSLNHQQNDQTPTIFLFSDSLLPDMQAELIRLGVRFLLRKPTESHILINLINRYAVSSVPAFSHTHFTEAENIELCVTRLLNICRIPYHVMGYCYLRECIIAVIEDEELAISMTKILYPCIAKRHHTSWECVERDIRSAIGLAEKNTGENEEIWRDCRTNRKLILKIAELTRMEMRRNHAARAYWSKKPSEEFG